MAEYVIIGNLVLLIYFFTIDNSVRYMGIPYSEATVPMLFRGLHTGCLSVAVSFGSLPLIELIFSYRLGIDKVQKCIGGFGGGGDNVVRGHR